jgi:hypothetical protein
MPQKPAASQHSLDVPLLSELDRSLGSGPLHDYLVEHKTEFQLIQRKGRDRKVEVNEPLELAAAWLEYGARYERQMRPDRPNDGQVQLQEILRLAKTAGRNKSSFRKLILRISPHRLNWFARLHIVTAVRCGDSEDESIMAESLEKVRCALTDKDPEKRKLTIENLIQAIEPAVLEKSWAEDLGGPLVPDQPARTLISLMAHAYLEVTGKRPTHFNSPPVKEIRSAPGISASTLLKLPDRSPAPFTALMRAIGKSVVPNISDTKLDRLIRQTIPRADGSVRLRKHSGRR